jgi:hypothetical protein
VSASPGHGDESSGSGATELVNCNIPLHIVK